MEVVFSLHAAWVWNNDLLSLSLFFVFLLCCDVHPLWFWDCALLFAPPPRHSTLLLSSLSLLSVVYQDGFYGAADLYVSTLTSGPTHLPLPPPPLHSFLLLSPLRVILHVASSLALHRVACIKVNEPTVYKHKARLVKKLASPLFFWWNSFNRSWVKHSCGVLITPLSWLLCGRMLALMRVSVWLRVWTRECMCIQVDNSCFCSLYRLVFQDSVLSPRLPQVGSTEHQTHSVNYFTVLPPLILWIIFWSELESVWIYFIFFVFFF